MEASVALAQSDADKLQAAVDDLIEHQHDDLPPGPLSDHGDFIADRFLAHRSEAEFRRLAELGKAIVDNHIATS